MPKFRKKPVVIEAEQFTGEIPSILYDGNDEVSDIRLGVEAGSDQYTYLAINTLEGVMKATHGDWIIKGVNGEFYPCKPYIFEKTYEAVDE